jgi:sporulation protein YlmC with PRC-barrel domain
MLITHVKPTALWGKRVYDTRGRVLGEVVAIASRHGVVRKVLVQRAGPPSADTTVDSETLVVPAPEATIPPRLRVVR